MTASLFSLNQMIVTKDNRKVSCLFNQLPRCTDSLVVAVVQTSSEKESRYWMVYLEMGLWLSAPRLHCSVTLFSVLLITRTPPGAPGGPGVKSNERQVGFEG